VLGCPFTCDRLACLHRTSWMSEYSWMLCWSSTLMGEQLGWEISPRLLICPHRRGYSTPKEQLDSILTPGALLPEELPSPSRVNLSDDGMRCAISWWRLLDMLSDLVWEFMKLSDGFLEKGCRWGYLNQERNWLISSIPSSDNTRDGISRGERSDGNLVSFLSEKSQSLLEYSRMTILWCQTVEFSCLVKDEPYRAMTCPDDLRAPFAAHKSFELYGAGTANVQCERTMDFHDG
jgi:hypothetical protein